MARPNLNPSAPCQRLAVSILAPTIAILAFTSPANADWRNIHNGDIIPTQTYADQPYIVKTDDGAWLCIITTGAGREGQPGQHVATLRSADYGKTWSEPVALEPPGGPEASYAVMLKVPSGRVYAFYNHNTDNIREVIADNPPYQDGLCRRVDSLGHYVFKYSDDHGQTWSRRRHSIPVREMRIDRDNPYQGRIRFFWNVGKPFQRNGAGYVPLHKVGGFGAGFFTSNEGVLLKSSNILHETDPDAIQWQTLPDGEVGLRTPPGGGPISAEQSYAVLSDGSLYAVYRSIDGHPVNSYSRDGGHEWDEPRYKRFADGRMMKHPRAANFVWKCANGKYLYWFHNHGGRTYDDRNPAWLCAGIEADSPQGKVIRWSQPEILLYDDDPYIRMSYPDFIEDNGRYFFTETQKNIARVHEIDPDFLRKLWNQFDNHSVAREGLAFEWSASNPQAVVPSPPLASFVAQDSQRPDHGSKDLRGGFTIDLWLSFDDLSPGQIILDNRTPSGQGFALLTAARKTLELILNDGRSESRWACDVDALKANALHHVCAMVDGGPKIISYVIDGKFHDGGETRQFGWGRFNPNLRGISGEDAIRIAPRMNGAVTNVRIYNRALLTSEALGNHRAGLR